MGEEKEEHYRGARKILVMIQHMSIRAFPLTGILWTRTKRARNSGSVDQPVALVDLAGKGCRVHSGHTHFLKDQYSKVCEVAHICNLSPERFKSMCTTL